MKVSSRLPPEPALLRSGPEPFNLSGTGVTCSKRGNSGRFDVVEQDDGDPTSLAVAARGALAACRLWPQVHSGARARPDAPGTGLVKRELLRNGREELAHVLGALGRRLEEEEAGFPGVLLGVGGGYCALVWVLGDEVELVAREGDDDVLICLALQFLDPSFRFVQRRLFICGHFRGFLSSGEGGVLLTACVIS